MSWQAISWVLNYSKAEHGSRLVAIAIANRCDKSGENAFPSIARLCSDTRLTERAVQNAIRDLVSLGEVYVQVGQGPNRVNLFSMPGLRDSKEFLMTLNSVEGNSQELADPANFAPPTPQILPHPPANFDVPIRSKSPLTSPNTTVRQNQHAEPGALQTWIAFKQEMKHKLPEDEFKLWLRPMYLLKELSGGFVLLSLPPVTKIVEAARGQKEWLAAEMAKRGLKFAGFTKYPDDPKELPGGPEWDEVRQRIFNKRGENFVAKKFPKSAQGEKYGNLS